VARKVLRRPRAKQDLLEQAFFIANDNLDAAERFLDAAEAAFARLLEMPEIGGARAYRNERLAGLRLWPIPGFERHLIFYLPIESGIEVVRVLDAARDALAILERE